LLGRQRSCRSQLIVPTGTVNDSCWEDAKGVVPN
jgi:hypothetical protein